MDFTLKFEARVVFSVTFTVVIISGIAMNVSVLLVFVRNRSLRQHIANVFVINLAVIDMLNLVIVMPFSLASLGEGSWQFGDTACTLNAFFDSLFGLASVLTLAVISVDRWMAVMKPLHYRAKMTVGRASQMVTFVWIQATVFSIVPVFGDWYSFNYRYYACTFQSEYENTNYLLFVCIKFVMNIVISLVIMLVTYYFIFKVARSHSRRIACAVVQMFNTSVARQNIRKEGFRQREVRTAVKISFVIGAFLFCHIPYSLLRMVEVGQSNNSFISLPIMATIAAKWTAYSKSSINPFVYSLLQHRFRRALIDLFTRKQNRNRHDRFYGKQRRVTSESGTTLTSRGRKTVGSPTHQPANSLDHEPPTNAWPENTEGAST